MAANHTITAVFAITQFTITATSKAHGTISPIGVVLVNYGADQTFAVIPDTGYHVDTLLVDQVNQGPLLTYTFPNVTANHKIK